MIDNVVVPVATSYGLAEEYQYLKSSIQGFLTGLLLLTQKFILKGNLNDAHFSCISCFSRE